MSTKVEKAESNSPLLTLVRFMGCFIRYSLVEVFPAAGNCNNGSVNNVGSNGNYWSSSVNSSNVQNAYNLNFNSSNVNWQNNNNRHNGFAVRGVLGEHSSYSLYAAYDSFHMWLFAYIRLCIHYLKLVKSLALQEVHFHLWQQVLAM